jgi:dienelactone hydrolase
LFGKDARHQAEDLLAKSKIPYQMSLYAGTEHGFAVRANISDKLQRYAKEEAYLQAVRWFDVWLKDVKNWVNWMLYIWAMYLYIV